MVSETVKVFSEDALIYAAHARCKCGAGLCYVKNRKERQEETEDNWVCSDLLTTDKKMKVKKAGALFQVGTIEDENGIEHDQSYPFAFYEIKSELQPSQGGATTRPNGVVHHVSCGEPVWKCKCGNCRDTFVKKGDQ